MYKAMNIIILYFHSAFVQLTSFKVMPSSYYSVLLTLWRFIMKTHLKLSSVLSVIGISALLAFSPISVHASKHNSQSSHSSKHHSGQSSHSKRGNNRHQSNQQRHSKHRNSHSHGKRRYSTRHYSNHHHSHGPRVVYSAHDWFRPFFTFEYQGDHIGFIYRD